MRYALCMDPCGISGGIPSLVVDCTPACPHAHHPKVVYRLPLFLTNNECTPTPTPTHTHTNTHTHTHAPLRPVHACCHRPCAAYNSWGWKGRRGRKEEEAGQKGAAAVATESRGSAGQVGGWVGGWCGELIGKGGLLCTAG